MTPHELPAIHESLSGLAFPVDQLVPLEGNPRRGDVRAVVRSYKRFGQRKPIVARRRDDGTCEVIAGNHQLAAAKELHWPTIAVVFTTDDDATARAFALADNHTADLGEYDPQALADMIGDVALDSDLLEATSYSIEDIERLLDTADERKGASVTTPQLDGMTYVIMIECRGEAHQNELLERFDADGLTCRAVIA